MTTKKEKRINTLQKNNSEYTYSKASCVSYDDVVNDVVKTAFNKAAHECGYDCKADENLVQHRHIAQPVLTHHSKRNRQQAGGTGTAIGSVCSPANATANGTALTASLADSIYRPVTLTYFIPGDEELLLWALKGKEILSAIHEFDQTLHSEWDEGFTENRTEVVNLLWSAWREVRSLIKELEK